MTDTLDDFQLGTALTSDNGDIIRILAEHLEDACYEAAAVGEIGVMMFWHENGCDLDARTFAAVAGLGQLAPLKWLLKHNCPWDTYVYVQAAQNGHLHVLKWLRNRGCPWDRHAMSEYAAASGQLHVLKWLVAQGCDLGVRVFEAAIGGGADGCMAVLEWLHEQNVQFPYYYFTKAEIFGDYHRYALNDPDDWRNDEELESIHLW